MKKSLIVALATFSTVLFGITISAYADDHLATAVDAGGLDPATSHVFTVEKAVEAPGQGSPLSGEDHTTPASATTTWLVATVPTGWKGTWATTSCWETTAPIT